MITVETLNDAIAEALMLPRVKFSPTLQTQNWIKKKHADGGVHEPATLGAFLALQRHYESHAIFDLGAHFGYFTLFCQQNMPDVRVTAFEMHPRIYKELRKNAGWRAVCVNAVVSDAVERDVKVLMSGFNIYRKPDEGWDAVMSLPDVQKHIYLRDFVRTDFITLDKYCDIHGEPDLIKIDVEGYQAKAVLGAREVIERSRPPIIIELHEPEKIARLGTTNQETVQPLFDQGYQGFWCGNFRDADAVFEQIDHIDQEHDKLCIMVFAP